MKVQTYYPPTHLQLSCVYERCFYLDEVGKRNLRFTYENNHVDESNQPTNQPKLMTPPSHKGPPFTHEP